LRSIQTTIRSSLPASSTPWSTRSANRPRSEEACTPRLYNRLVTRLGNLFRNPFSFLFARSSKEDQVVAYITREHRRGRRLADILEDRYVQNRLTKQQQLRLLERPEVVRALGEQDIDAARETLATR
jgi:hypothetical protein